MLFEDDNEEVVGNVCQSLSRLLDECGPDLLSHLFDASDPHKFLLSAIDKLLQGQHPCQPFNRGKIDEDEESRAMEEYLFEGLSCLIASMASALGPQFKPLFDEMYPSILKLANHKKSASFRCIGLGCFAEVVKAMGESAGPYVDSVIKSALEGIRQSEDTHLQTNACLCMGIIFEVAPNHPSVQLVLLNVLEALNPIFVKFDSTDLTEDEEFMIDNAASCAARMMLHVSPNSLPLDRVVPAFLKLLPLRADPEECTNVLMCLLHFYHGGIPGDLLELNVENFLRASILQLLDAKSASVPADIRDKVDVMNATILKQLAGMASPVVRSLTLYLSTNPKASEFLMKTLQC